MKRYSLFILLLISVFISCKTQKIGDTKQTLYDNNTFKIEKYSNNSTYGYTQKDPIKVGGARNSEGPLNERRFLNALTGPNGEKITYIREGSCCQFNTKNANMNNVGLLDRYKISYDGLEKDIILYINMYDSEELKVPVGFKLKYE